MHKCAVILVGLLVPIGVSAQVMITEIMYDLPGNDSGREWVEIYNASNTAVNLDNWRFFEQDTNHRFQNEGDITLAPNERAVIADKIPAFKADNPGVDTLILDSTFSLKNTGEYIALKNADKEVIDALTYTPRSAADGEGASLQLINGAWGAYQPTPGDTNQKVSIEKNRKNESKETEEKREKAIKSVIRNEEEKTQSSKEEIETSTSVATNSIATQTPQTTAIIQTQENGSTGRWMLGLASVVMVGLGGIVLARFRETQKLHIQDQEAAREAREYEIIEINGNERK